MKKKVPEPVGHFHWASGTCFYTDTLHGAVES